MSLQIFMQVKEARELLPSLELEQILNKLLEALHSSYDTPTQWKIFYEFVTTSYRLGEKKRPSVSKFADILKEAQVPQPGSLAVLYAHGLYMLAVYEKIPIYEVFNP